MALFIDNNDNDKTFFGNIVYLCPRNIPSKSHVIPLFKSNIIERYSIRPDSISVVDKLCLVEFAAYYYKDYRKDSDETNDAEPNVLTDEVIHTQHSILQDISLPSQITLMNTKEKNEMQKS